MAIAVDGGAVAAGLLNRGHLVEIAERIFAEQAADKPDEIRANQLVHDLYLGRGHQPDA
mgnify:CR=1 FL=1